MGKRPLAVARILAIDLGDQGQTLECYPHCPTGLRVEQACALRARLTVTMRNGEQNMKTQEISRAEWPGFFDGFSRDHEGAQVTLEVFGSEIGDQIEGRDLTLEGITAELSGAGDRIGIMITATPDGHLTHSIAAPTQVSVEQTDEGSNALLAIKSKDGLTALLRLRPSGAAGDG